MKRTAHVLAVLLMIVCGVSLLPGQTGGSVLPVFSNLDAPPLHREVVKFFHIMTLVQRLETRIPSRLVPTLEAATAQTVLSEVSRGTAAGSLNILAGNTGPILFTLDSAQWVNEPIAGKYIMTVSVDRSFDNGASWRPQFGYVSNNLGSANCTPGPIPNSGGKVETCTPRLKVNLDGIDSIWRWTLVPQVDGASGTFVWGATATF